MRIDQILQIYFGQHIYAKPIINDSGLQLSPVEINEEYRKKWNIHSSDFVMLTKNGELVSDSLYRVGGFGADIKQDYFILIKHVESIYDFDFIKNCYPNLNKKELKLRQKHLESRWCIIDKKGVEKIVFDKFKSPYLIDNSCIYSLDNYYFNIETGECYGYSTTSISSTEFLFLDNKFEKDKSKKGVMKINKKDGTWELFS